MRPTFGLFRSIFVSLLAGSCCIGMSSSWKTLKSLGIGMCSVMLAGATPDLVLTAERYSVQCEKDLEQFEALFHKLENVEGAKTEESLLEPFNNLEILMGNSGRKARLYFNAHPDAAIRAVAKQHSQNLSTLGGKIYTSVPVYDALKSVDSPTDRLARRLLEDMLRDYRRSGVNQPEKIREKIRELNDELTALGQTFSKNIRSDVRFIELDSEDELAGMPADYIAAHAPDENGKIRITTNYPDYAPFMRYCQSSERRSELYKLFRNRGYPDNKQVLENILIKRYELVKLLGYNHYADYMAETRMIGSDEEIQSFIDRMASLARPRAEREYVELLDRLRKVEPTAENVDMWNAGFLSEMIRQEKYEVDAKQVRTYFRFGHVRDGILELTAKLFGVTYRRWDTGVWHDDVVAYEMLENGKVIGRFYFDLHPRDNKFKHAAHFALLDGIAGRQIPTAALLCNFPGKGDDEALMEHSQVETFLHEFGHLLHHLFSGQQRWAYFSGVATERDFVEAPSQMLEEWIWNAEALEMIAANKDGAPIPGALLAKMTAARDFGVGLRVCGQMNLAAMSLNYYNCDPATLDVDQTMIDLSKKYSLYEYVPGTHMYANFGHLFGYSAGYYTYMWSLVISKDLLSRFESEGMLNQSTAREYRDTVLAPGGSKDAAKLVEDFLGRPYSFAPFEKWLNSNAEAP